MASLDSQVAGNNWPPYPKADQCWIKVAHNCRPLALQGACICAFLLSLESSASPERANNLGNNGGLFSAVLVPYPPLKR